MTEWLLFVALIGMTLFMLGIAHEYLKLARRVAGLEAYVRSLRAHTEGWDEAPRPPRDYAGLDVPAFLRPQAE